MRFQTLGLTSRDPQLNAQLAADVVKEWRDEAERCKDDFGLHYIALLEASLLADQFGLRDPMEVKP